MSPNPPHVLQQDAPLIVFGDLLRQFRERANMTQQALAEATFVSQGQISKVETGQRVASSDLVLECDKVLKADGTLTRVWSMIAREVHPPWFKGWVDLERQARSLRTHQNTLIPGLLQTEAYAHEMVAYGQPDVHPSRVREFVTARMERQTILDREDSPELWVVLDHAVLERGVGGRPTMKAQLAKLRQAIENPKVTIQIIPPDVATHPGLTGAFVLASFAQGPDALYLDTAWEGQVVQGGTRVEQVGRLFDILRSEALPIRKSEEYIARMEEQWT